jgi:hypothetical protein
VNFLPLVNLLLHFYAAIFSFCCVLLRNNPVVSYFGISIYIEILMTTYRILRSFFVVLTVVVVSSCASVQKPVLEKKLNAKQAITASTIATPSSAQVYVYRNETLGGALSMPVRVNGKLVGKTGPKTFLTLNLPAGTHKFTSQGDKSTLEVTTENGKIYYIWQEVKIGLISGGSKLQLVDEKKGREGVKQCTLIESSP